MEQFTDYYPPSDEDRERALKTGLICMDTNVLLDAYRFGPQARDELLRILGNFRDRIWIPHQVALEFHRNRVKVIASQGKAYSELIDSLEKLERILMSDVTQKANALSKTIALSAGGANLLEPLLTAWKSVADKVGNLKEEHGVTLDELNNDPIVRAYEKIFAGRVGKQFDPDAEVAARREADMRIKKKIPPGYMDAPDKSDPAGDYLLWRQILEEGQKRKVPIVLVTRDVKEDWFRREGGRTISARPELIREARDVAGVDLIIMETRSFLYNARKISGKEMDGGSLIREIDELPPISSSGSIEGKDLFALAVRFAVLSAGFVLADGLYDSRINFFFRGSPGDQSSPRERPVGVVLKYFESGSQVTTDSILRQSATGVIVVTNARVVGSRQHLRDKYIEVVEWSDRDGDLLTLQEDIHRAAKRIQGRWKE